VSIFVVMVQKGYADLLYKTVQKYMSMYKAHLWLIEVKKQFWKIS